MKTKSNKALIGSGVLTAIAASLCCITPVLALIAGTSGMAFSFSWMEPFRPYLMGFTVLVLGFAWYQKLKPRTAEEIQCACEEDEKPSFWQSKKFLGIVTVFAALMLAFPYYSSVFFPDNNKKVVIVGAVKEEVKEEVMTIRAEDVGTLNLYIEGMTCPACNFTVQNAALDVSGVFESTADYKTGKAIVKFDKSKAQKEDIIKSINATEYEVIREENK